MTTPSLKVCRKLSSVPIFLIVLLFAFPTAELYAASDAHAVAGRYLADTSGNFDEARFLTTVRQRHDFSCGAAALATLLIYHYQEPIAEDEVFDAMLAAGDKDKIRAQGFSMLDMKRYLEERGFEAAGYEVSLDRMAVIGLPAIVLLSYDGYNHFVVVKGVAGSEVLIGDPAVGVRVVPRDEFESAWNGLIFVIRSNSAVGKRNFNRRTEWFLGAHTVVEATPGLEEEPDTPVFHARREGSGRAVKSR